MPQHQLCFVNLPVTDLARSRAFFTQLGYAFREDFCDGDALCVQLGPTVYAMLLRCIGRSGCRRPRFVLNSVVKAPGRRGRNTLRYPLPLGLEPGRYRIRLWTEERVEFEGDYYRTHAATVYDRPEVPVPVYVAAGGPLVARYAGRSGDGFICTSGKGRELYEDKLLPAIDEE